MNALSKDGALHPGFLRLYVVRLSLRRGDFLYYYASVDRTGMRLATYLNDAGVMDESFGVARISKDILRYGHLLRKCDARELRTTCCGLIHSSDYRSIRQSEIVF